jgi:hypothetical protein
VYLRADPVTKLEGHALEQAEDLGELADQQAPMAEFACW